MGAEVVLETEAGNDQDGREDLLVLMPDAIEVRRNAGTAGLLGVAGAAIAIAYFARATQTGAVLDWVLALIMGLLGAYWLRSLVDARTPLLVADDQGLRLRLGRRWHGLPWSAVNRLEYTPRQGLLREGRISVAPHNDEVLVVRRRRWLSGFMAPATRSHSDSPPAWSVQTPTWRPLWPKWSKDVAGSRNRIAVRNQCRRTSIRTLRTTRTWRRSQTPNRLPARHPCRCVRRARVAAQRSGATLQNKAWMTRTAHKAVSCTGQGA